MAQYITFKPNRQKVSHTWKTGIQKSLNGSEKRSAIQTYPRVKIDTSYGFDDHAKSMWLKTRLFHKMGEHWGVPLWADQTPITSTAAGSQSVINVTETDYRHFYVNRKGIVIDQDDWTTYEVFDIDSITSTSITISGTLVSSWAVDDIVMPLYECRISPTQMVSRRVRAFDEFSIQATEEFEGQNPFTYTLPTSSGAYTTYSGYDVFLSKPHTKIDYSFNQPYTLTQFYGLGYKETYYDTDQTNMPMKFELIENTKEEIWNWFLFFDNKMGRLETFWIPTWNKDIILTAGFSSTDTTLNMENVDYSTYWEINTLVGRHLYIQFPDKTYTIRKVDSATNTVITLDSQIGTTVTDYLACYISFLNFSRFDIDELEINYHPNNVTATTQLSFYGVSEETI